MSQRIPEFGRGSGRTTRMLKEAWEQASYIGKGETMKYILKFIAEWANRQAEKTSGAQREAYNYLSHYALIARAQQ